MQTKTKTFPNRVFYLVSLQVGILGSLMRTGLTLFLFFVVTAAWATAQTSTGFVKQSVDLNGESYLYQVYVPPHWTPTRKWPVILFLHGAGERGSEGVEQTSVGLPSALPGGREFPAVVVMPQCRRGMWWGDETMEAQVFKILDLSMDRYQGDPDQVYLTGLSMGGYGTWAFGYKYPDRFAALVPVCGSVRSRRSMRPPAWHPAADPTSDPYLLTASRIAKVPVWVFHGSADTVVPVSESRMLSEALRKSGGNVRYTEYKGVGHNSWDRAYGEKELIPWLLSQKRAGATR